MAKKSKGKGDDQEPDIENLMNILLEDIKRCYPSIFKMPESFDPIQMLHDIEHAINQMVNQIDFIQNAPRNDNEDIQQTAIQGNWAKLLEEQEANRREARFNAQKKLREDASEERKRLVQANLEKRMNLKSKRVGKIHMERSKKEKMKKKVEKKVFDQDAEDQKKYLGVDLKSLDQIGQMA